MFPVHLCVCVCFQGANCGAGLQCKPLPCEDLHACTKLSHICVGMLEILHL